MHETPTPPSNPTLADKNRQAAYDVRLWVAHWRLLVDVLCQANPHRAKPDHHGHTIATSS